MFVVMIEKCSSRMSAHHSSGLCFCLPAFVASRQAETLHVLLVIFGVLHTLLGSSAEQHAAQMVITEALAAWLAAAL